jgi:hypothetical protein
MKKLPRFLKWQLFFPAFENTLAYYSVVNSEVVALAPGASPAIVSYNASVVNFYSASVVNFYSATGSLACFENKNILFYFEKRSSLLQRGRCSCKFKSRRIGSWPEKAFFSLERKDIPFIVLSLQCSHLCTIA